LGEGSEPGSAKHTGQVCAFGSAPKAVGQRQNSLLAVSSCAWTSRPMTVS
jgi:hypothetical protein